MTIKVGVVGYGTIGKRVADAVLLQEDMELVGITGHFSVNMESVYKIASSVKNIDKDIITILGGPHPSIKPYECLQNSNVDFIVIGEGEYTMRDLVQSLEKSNIKLRDINGIAYLKGKDD